MLNWEKYKTKENLAILSILVVFSLIWLYLFLNFSTLWAQDSFWYARLGENLATGKGFTLDGINPHAQYPIGLPLLIVPFFFLTGSAPTAGIILMFLLSLASIILAYLIGKEINSTTGIISTILLSSHNLFIFNSMSVMTESAFMFFSVLGLYLFMKSYEKRSLIIPSIICITFSILIRYDGFFLIVPMVFYMFYRKKDFDDFFFSKKTFIAIGIGIAIVGAWLLRNWISLGGPFKQAFTSYAHDPLTLRLFLSFFILFFKTGYLFPILALLGIFFVIFKVKNIQLKTFLVWALTYMALHAWWWARALRFYGQILIILCLFGAIALNELYKLFPRNKKKLAKIILGILVILIVLEQLFIFSSGIINHESTIDTLNRYNPIKQASEYANQNLPEDAIYVFPEYVVYTEFLDKKNLLDYNSGLNYLFSTNGTIYFFTDSHHPWITNPFIPKNGKIILSVPTQQGVNVNVLLNPKLIKNFEYFTGKQTFNATIWKIDGFEVIS
jgi:4-amino-4-deoxy-L-arabinose transferase-like glycosyltransferase